MGSSVQTAAVVALVSLPICAADTGRQQSIDSVNVFNELERDRWYHPVGTMMPSGKARASPAELPRGLVVRLYYSAPTFDLVGGA
jgi:hypothetical protein